jgi:hypothetical protein
MAKRQGLISDLSDTPIVLWKLAQSTHAPLALFNVIMAQVLSAEGGTKLRTQLTSHNLSFLINHQFSISTLIAHYSFFSFLSSITFDLIDISKKAFTFQSVDQEVSKPLCREPSGCCNCEKFLQKVLALKQKICLSYI